MDYEHVIAWLTRKLRSDALLSAVVGIVAFVGGVVILALTWGLIYAVCFYSLCSVLGLNHWSYTLVPTIMIPLLFWGNATTSQEYLSEHSVTTGTASDKVVVFYLPRIGMVSNVNPLAPDTVRTMVKMITDCLYFGPRVMTSAFRMLGKAIRFLRMDVSACAAVIAVLAEAGHRMSFQDIADSIDGLNPVSTFPQLHEIEGILFLSNAPAGLALETSLKDELKRLSQEASGHVRQ